MDRAKWKSECEIWNLLKSIELSLKFLRGSVSVCNIMRCTCFELIYDYYLIYMQECALFFLYFISIFSSARVSIECLHIKYTRWWCTEWTQHHFINLSKLYPPTKKRSKSIYKTRNKLVERAKIMVIFDITTFFFNATHIYAVETMKFLAHTVLRMYAVKMIIVASLSFFFFSYVLEFPNNKALM